MIVKLYDVIKYSYQAAPHVLMSDLSVIKAHCRARVHSVLSCVKKNLNYIYECDFLSIHYLHKDKQCTCNLGASGAGN